MKFKDLFKVVIRIFYHTAKTNYGIVNLTFGFVLASIASITRSIIPLLFEGMMKNREAVNDDKVEGGLSVPTDEIFPTNLMLSINLSQAAIIYGIAFGIPAIIDCIRSLSFAPTLDEASRNLREKLLRSVLEIPLNKQNKTIDVNELINKTDPALPKTTVNSIEIIPDFFEVFLSASILLYVNQWKIGTSVFGILFADVIFVLFASGKLADLLRIREEVVSNSNAKINDIPMNKLTIMQFEQKDIVLANAEQALQDRKDLYSKYNSMSNFYEFIHALILHGGFLFVIYLSAMSTCPEEDFVLVHIIMLNLVTSMMAVGTKFNNITEAATLFKDVFDVLDQAKQNKLPQPRLRFNPKLGKHILYKNVSIFNFKNELLLEKINLKFKEGETIFFMGKRERVNFAAYALFGNQVAYQGSIVINGNNISQANVGRLIGTVVSGKRSPLSFGKSVLYNVKFARPEASDKEVHQAVEKSGLQEIIRYYKKGLHTILKKDDNTLEEFSFKLQLCRLLLSQAAICILEFRGSNSSDSSFKKKLTEFLNCFPTQTKIVLTHQNRANSVRGLGRLLFFNEDRSIVEENNDLETIKEKSRHRKLKHHLSSSDLLTEIQEVDDDYEKGRHNLRQRKPSNSNLDEETDPLLKPEVKKPELKK